MRPVNLIPQEQRRDGRVSRTGPLVYVVIAGLCALLAGVAILVLTSNQISERESEVTELTAQKAAIQVKADSLAPYVKFQTMEKQRTATISELADSRFDWPRVIRQLSLIIPRYVVLTKLSGTAGGGAGGGESSTTGGLTSGIKGPSLSLLGCAASQNRVAALIVALRQIDGVTRVGLGSSVKASATGSSSGGSGGCEPGETSYTIAVAFDAAPASPDSAAVVAAPVEASEPESGSSESESSSSKSSETEAGSAETTVSKTTTVTPPN